MQAGVVVRGARRCAVAQWCRVGGQKGEAGRKGRRGVYAAGVAGVVCDREEMPLRSSVFVLFFLFSIYYVSSNHHHNTQTSHTNSVLYMFYNHVYECHAQRTMFVRYVLHTQ